MSNWGVKQPKHHNRPQPSKPVNDAIHILAA
jgi:hypothetical protein